MHYKKNCICINTHRPCNNRYLWFRAKIHKWTRIDIIVTTRFTYNNTQILMICFSLFFDFCEFNNWLKWLTTTDYSCWAHFVCQAMYINILHIIWYAWSLVHVHYVQHTHFPNKYFTRPVSFFSSIDENVSRLTEEYA